MALALIVGGLARIPTKQEDARRELPTSEESRWKP